MRWRGFVVHICTEPVLTQAVNDAGQVVTEHFAELPLNFFLQVALNHTDTVERRADLDALEGVVFEYERDALVARDDQYHDST